MFVVTDNAAKKLKAALEERDTSEDACLRLGEAADGLKMVIDQQRPGDTAIQYDDKVLLVMDPATAGRLEGRTMDFNADTEQLVFS